MCSVIQKSLWQMEFMYAYKGKKRDIFKLYVRIKCLPYMFDRYFMRTYGKKV